MRQKKAPTPSPRYQLIGNRPKQQQRRQAPHRQHAFHASTTQTKLGRKRRPPMLYHDECNCFRGCHLRPLLGAAQ